MFVTAGLAQDPDLGVCPARTLRCGRPAGSQYVFPQVNAGVAQLVEQRFRKPVRTACGHGH